MLLLAADGPGWRCATELSSGPNLRDMERRPARAYADGGQASWPANRGFMRVIRRVLAWVYGHPYLLLTLTMLMWGGNAVAGRLAVGEVSPMALTFLRWVVPVAILGFALRHQILAHRQVLVERWPSVVLMGTLGFTVFNALFYLAAHHTTAVNITIL